MNIYDLEQLILDKPDDMSWDEWYEVEVLVPFTGKQEGVFLTPCIDETGISDMWEDEENPDNQETFPVFLIVPCGFFPEMHDDLPPQLN